MVHRLLVTLLIALTLAPALATSTVTPAHAQEGDVVVVEETATEPATAAEPTAPPAEPTATETPTEIPTAEPTVEPTQEPTVEHTDEPTSEPTAEPTQEPATEPATEAATDPTPEPTAEPSPTVQPTGRDESDEPTVTPEETDGRKTNSVQAQSAGVARIRSVDSGNHLLPNACFAIHHDAGSGTPGAGIAEVCDYDNDDGVSTYELDPGAYVLIQTTPPYGYGKADNKSFSISSGKTTTVSVTQKPLSRIVIHAIEVRTGTPALEACFDLAPLTPVWPPQDYRSCDEWDGVLDGNITIGMVDRGRYTLGEFIAPWGYLPAIERQVTMSALDATVEVTVNHLKGAELVVQSQDQAGQPLLGACFYLHLPGQGGTPGEIVTSACDNGRGDNDGETVIAGVQGGTYVLRQENPPLGYLPTANQTVQLTRGQSETVTWTNQQGGIIQARSRDAGNAALTGSCFALYLDAGGGSRGAEVATRCDYQDQPDDGAASFVGLATGAYVVSEFFWPRGYLPAADQRVSITAGQTKTLDFTNPLGGHVLVHVVDEDDKPVLGACFVARSEALQRTESACDGLDEPKDGALTIGGLETGEYTLEQSSTPTDHEPMTGDGAFEVTRGGEAEVTVVNRNYGILIARNRDPQGNLLPMFCVTVYRDAGNGELGDPVYGRCDGHDGNTNGVISFAIPAGDHVLVQDGAPIGWVAGANVPFQVEPGEEVAVNVVSRRPSSVVARTRDVFDQRLKGACFAVHHDDGNGQPGNQITTACDFSDNQNDGDTTLTGFGAGDYLLVQTSAPAGYTPAEPVAFVVGVEGTRVLVVVNKGQPAKITVGPVLTGLSPTSVVIYWETNQATDGVVEFGTSQSLGSRRIGAGPDGTIHRVALTSLSPARSYHFRIRSENANGEVVSEIFTFRTPAASRTGRVIVTKVGPDREPLANACFAAYIDAGGGQLGEFITGACDRFDATPNDGKTTLTGFGASSFVLVETVSPPGHSLAANRTFTLTAGQTLRLTVQDAAGGARVTVRTKDESGAFVEDSCYAVYAKNGDDSVGAYVTSNCDQFDGRDGRTILGNLKPGGYFLWQTFVPDGYLQPELLPFSVSRTQTTKTLDVVLISPESPGLVIARTVNADGDPVHDVCLALYQNDGDGRLGAFRQARCDGMDGVLDGVVYFFNVQPDSYVLLAYYVPPGYQLGRKVQFTKVSERQRVLNVRLAEGGVAVTVTTLKGSGSSKLPGACYAIYRRIGTGAVYEFVSDSCDVDNDGVVRFTGVRSGTYLLVQIQTPPGYHKPQDVVLTVRTSPVSKTIRTNPA
jgi:uncharacterized surface anchored protein